MSSKAIVTFCVMLSACFFNGQALSKDAVLRFDGIYHRTDLDAVTQHFRFYRDGTVISVATPAEMTPAKIARWFHRGWPSLAEGNYSVRGQSVQITLKSGLPRSLLPEAFRRKVPGTIHYTGEIGSDHLILRRNGNAQGKQHDFVKVVFTK